MEAEVKRRKRRVVLVALAACLVVAGIGGTLAWFSAQSSLTNTFKVGNITDPTTKPDKPSENLPSDTTKVSGNIYEPSWVDQSAIAPGASVAKDPYVGIGKESESAYVYVYVKNNLPEGAYFTIEQGWEAVEATLVSGSQDQYTGGLFAYASNYQNGAGLTELKPTGTPAADAWTKNPLFKSIMTSDTFVANDTNKTVEVYAYVAAKSNNSESTTDLDAAADAWAAEIKMKQ